MRVSRFDAAENLDDLSLLVILRLLTLSVESQHQNNSN